MQWLDWHGLASKQYSRYCIFASAYTLPSVISALRLLTHCLARNHVRRSTRMCDSVLMTSRAATITTPYSIPVKRIECLGCCESLILDSPLHPRWTASSVSLVPPRLISRACFISFKIIVYLQIVGVTRTRSTSRRFSNKNPPVQRRE